MGNILIADCGSTKIHWAEIDCGQRAVKEFVTTGVNPAVMPAERISGLFVGELHGKFSPSGIARVDFYGAGCRGEANCKAVADALLPMVGDAQINVESDMLGACRALLGGKRGIACILGTGANSCLYDGERIVANVSPGGYILGDEGSGAWLGRRLAGDVLKGLLPDELEKRFYSRFDLSPAEMLRRVYRPAAGEDAPNRFLASFAPFLSENLDEACIRGIVKEGFTEFFMRNVACYAGYGAERDVEVNFVGSVAMAFSLLLRQTAAELGFNVGRIVRSPMELLINNVLGSEMSEVDGFVRPDE